MLNDMKKEIKKNNDQLNDVNIISIYCFNYINYLIISLIQIVIEKMIYLENWRKIIIIMLFITAVSLMFIIHSQFYDVYYYY